MLGAKTPQAFQNDQRLVCWIPDITPPFREKMATVEHFDSTFISFPFKGDKHAVLPPVRQHPLGLRKSL